MLLATQVQAKVEMQLERQLPEVQGAACIGISALTGKGMPAVMPAVMDAFRVWTQRVPTSRLNKWLVKVGVRSQASTLIYQLGQE